ncbi:hypothetical protein DCO48_15810 [Pseudomonas sp. SDI]|nr:hypothetical protein DCO48_15810 [Pseudomonas sp. SDI]
MALCTKAKTGRSQTVTAVARRRGRTAIVRRSESREGAEKTQAGLAVNYIGQGGRGAQGMRRTLHQTTWVGRERAGLPGADGDAVDRLARHMNPGIIDVMGCSRA